MLARIIVRFYWLRVPVGAHLSYNVLTRMQDVGPDRLICYHVFFISLLLQEKIIQGHRYMNKELIIQSCLP